MGNTIVQKLIFPIPDESQMQYTLNFITSSNATHSIPYFIANPPHQHRKWCILYSHGNAENLGLVYDWCSDLSVLLGCTVIAYDYCGYGAHRLWGDGTYPTEKNVYADIKDMYELSRTFGKVILWGRSLGTAPTIWLAAQPRIDPVGVVIQSGFRSIVQTISSNALLRHWDLFKSEAVIGNVTAPTVFIHGTRDDVCPFAHGKFLFEHCGSDWKKCVWIVMAGHNDIDSTTEYRRELINGVLMLRDKLKLEVF